MPLRECHAVAASEALRSLHICAAARLLFSGAGEAAEGE